MVDFAKPIAPDEVCVHLAGELRARAATYRREIGRLEDRAQELEETAHRIEIDGERWRKAQPTTDEIDEDPVPDWAETPE